MLQNVFGFVNAKGKGIANLPYIWSVIINPDQPTDIRDVKGDCKSPQIRPGIANPDQQIPTGRRLRVQEIGREKNEDPVSYRLCV